MKNCLCSYLITTHTCTQANMSSKSLSCVDFHRHVPGDVDKENHSTAVWKIKTKFRPLSIQRIICKAAAVEYNQKYLWYLQLVNYSCVKQGIKPQHTVENNTKLSYRTCIKLLHSYKTLKPESQNNSCIFLFGNKCINDTTIK